MARLCGIHTEGGDITYLGTLRLLIARGGFQHRALNCQRPHAVVTSGVRDIQLISGTSSPSVFALFPPSPFLRTPTPIFGPKTLADI